MKSNYKPLGNYIKQIKKKNTDGSVSVLKGIRINKEFMESVANIQGTDLSRYRVVEKHQFAYNPMHVGRDEILPISVLLEDDPIIVSPAYVVFEILDHNILDPEYLMMWCRRSEFDRNVWFTTDSSVRGGFSWESLCELELPIPSIEKQREIVKEYNTIVNRIKLNETLNQKLEDTAQALYKHWFVDFEFPNADGKPYKSSGGEMVYNEELDLEIPEGWEVLPIENLFSVKDGTHDSPKPVKKGMPLVTSTHLKPFDIAIQDTYNISEEDYNQINRRSQVEQFDILFSMIGTVGLIHFVQMSNVQFAIKNVGLFKCSEKRELAEYVLCYLKGNNCLEYIKSSMAGSTQNYVTLSTLRNIPFLEPKKEFLKAFNLKIQPLVNGIYIIVNENQLLENTKSLILSKMSKVETNTVVV
ncbi:restriction endonuclease subunit S [Tenacibaculum aquimarinum]|uniref:restriction endonuclease subunit S n=1 Tax=Tenacibaculum aquimarinum TaxID=2910675 RepID=UPI001F0A9123|nr:restriction endonuclease subunit S [Tenacibaculum aquimarinum]MCH3881708.1 restriction endonuclease subunit S [Tenacibaculum aquimarinum]